MWQGCSTGWLDDDEHAIFSLNNIWIDIAKMNDLVLEADDIKERDVDMFLKPKFVHQLNANVEKYIEKAKSENEKTKKHYTDIRNNNIWS